MDDFEKEVKLDLVLVDGRPAFILDLIELFAGSMKKKKTNYKDEMAA